MFQEATRLIELQLHIIPSSESSSLHLRVPPGATRDSEYPPLYFGGTSRGVNGNEASVEGCVRMGEDGVARWQFVSFKLNGSIAAHGLDLKASLYGGHSQWRYIAS